MGRSTKKTMSQNIVSVATTGMPSPVRKYLGGRIASLLIVLTIPVLLATGVVSITWMNGRPSLSVDKQRAAEVKSNAAERLEQVADGLAEDQPDLANRMPRLGIQRDTRSGLGDTVGQRVEQLKDKFDEDLQQTWSSAPIPVPQESTTRRASKPFSRFRDRIEKRR